MVVSLFVAVNGYVVIRLSTFLLNLHSLSRNRDTSSVSASPIHLPLSGEGLRDVMRAGYRTLPDEGLRIKMFVSAAL